jgi:hypothetical protein
MTPTIRGHNYDSTVGHIIPLVSMTDDDRFHRLLSSQLPAKDKSGTCTQYSVYFVSSTHSEVGKQTSWLSSERLRVGSSRARRGRKEDALFVVCVRYIHARPNLSYPQPNPSLARRYCEPELS